MALAARALNAKPFNFIELPANQGSQYTGCAWVRLHSAAPNTGGGTDSSHPIFAHHETANLLTTERCLSISPSGTLQGYFYPFASSGIYSSSSERVPLDGRWHHLAMTYNGTLAELWIDGRRVAATDFSGAALYTYGTPKFRVGHSNSTVALAHTNNNSRILDIADAAHWNAALSAAELKALASGLRIPSAIRRANLGAFIRFDAEGATDHRTKTRGTVDSSTSGWLTLDHPLIGLNAVRKRPVFPAASSGDVVGSLAQTLGALTLTGTADLLVNGSLTQTLGALTLAGVGAGAGINGSLAQTLGALTLTGTADLLVDGSLAQTLGALTLTGTADLLVNGSLTQTLGALTLAGSGIGAAGGSLNVTLGALTLTGTADLLVNGSLAQTLGALTLTGTADLLVNGSLAQTLGALTLSATNSLGASGALVQTLAPLGLSAIGFGPWVIQSPTPTTWNEQSSTPTTWVDVA